MIRTTAVPRPARVGAAVVGVLGIVTLAGCAGGTADAETGGDTPGEAPSSAASESSDTGTGGSGSLAGGAYADGEYTAQGSYATPESVETIEVTITLEGDLVTAVRVEGDPQAAESQRYQSEFIGGIEEEVVGKNLDEISVDRVAGSSLTSGGFDEALESIKTDAAA